ncbi:MAG: helix-turn-helix domain-containing protein [Bacteroidota bacterium]
METKPKSLKELRRRKSLTQEELSHASGISVRTIQRIEKGVSTGAPYTIKALAKALQVESSELLVVNGLASAFPADYWHKVRLMNFSVLSVFLLPLGNLILPTLIFLFNRQDEGVNSLGRKIISFQIVATPVLFFLTVIIFLVVGRGNGAIPLPVIICYALFVSFSTLVVILTSISIDKEQDCPKFFPRIL